MTQLEKRLSLADNLAQADAHLRDAKRRKLAYEQDGILCSTKRAEFGMAFYLSISLCAESVWEILAARDMYARVDAGHYSLDECGDDDETLDPETLTEVEAIAVAAELILSEIHRLTK